MFSAKKQINQYYQLCETTQFAKQHILLSKPLSTTLSTTLSKSTTILSTASKTNSK